MIFILGDCPKQGAITLKNSSTSIFNAILAKLSLLEISLNRFFHLSDEIDGISIFSDLNIPVVMTNRTSPLKIIYFLLGTYLIFIDDPRCRPSSVLNAISKNQCWIILIIIKKKIKWTQSSGGNVNLRREIIYFDNNAMYVIFNFTFERLEIEELYFYYLWLSLTFASSTSALSDKPKSRHEIRGKTIIGWW